MLDEDVDVERRHQRVAQRVLLEQEAGIGAWLNVPPRAPLVQGQPHALAWIVLVMMAECLVMMSSMRMVVASVLAYSASSNAVAEPFRCQLCVMVRSEEHTSELQSPCNLVCRL